MGYEILVRERLAGRGRPFYLLYIKYHKIIISQGKQLKIKNAIILVRFSVILRIRVVLGLGVGYG